MTNPQTGAAELAEAKRLLEIALRETAPARDAAVKRAEHAEAQLAEVDAHRRKVLAENERLLNGFIEKERQLAEANKALDEVVGCFDAAYAEGLQERLNDEVERDPGSLYDLITRRLLYAFSATRRAREG